MTDAPPPPPFEQTKRAETKMREDAYWASDRLNSRRDMLNQAAIKAAEAALRSGLLINGGAALSILAFMGSLASREKVPLSQLSPVADSLRFFAFGSSPPSSASGRPI